MQIKVEVKANEVLASSPDVPNANDVPYPLRIPAINALDYFDPRQSFNIVGYLKTPYGAMIAFMLGSMVIMPMLKVDPEEYKEMVEERKKITKAIGIGGNERKQE